MTSKEPFCLILGKFDSSLKSIQHPVPGPVESVHKLARTVLRRQTRRKIHRQTRRSCKNWKDRVRRYCNNRGQLAANISSVADPRNSEFSLILYQNAFSIESEGSRLKYDAVKKTNITNIIMAKSCLFSLPWWRLFLYLLNCVVSSV